MRVRSSKNIAGEMFAKLQEPQSTKLHSHSHFRLYDINYYGKFVSNSSRSLHLLNMLLQAGIIWNWSINCEKAFQEAKKKLASAKLLTHYDHTLPIKLAADASAYGVGVVIWTKSRMELKTNSLYFMHTESNGKELCSVGKGSFVSGVRSK